MADGRPDWVYAPDDGRGMDRVLAEGVRASVYAGENSMLSVARVDPHSGTERHSHPEEQWGILLEGECVRVQGGDEVAVEAGDFWHTPGGVEHSVRTGERGAVILDVFSPPRPHYRDGNDGSEGE